MSNPRGRQRAREVYRSSLPQHVIQGFDRAGSRCFPHGPRFPCAMDSPTWPDLCAGRRCPTQVILPRTERCRTGGSSEPAVLSIPKTSGRKPGSCAPQCLAASCSQSTRIRAVSPLGRPLRVSPFSREGQSYSRTREYPEFFASRRTAFPGHQLRCRVPYSPTLEFAGHFRLDSRGQPRDT